MAVPPTWIPPSASQRAQKAWSESPFTRARKLLYADEKTIAEYVTVGIESFSAQEMNWAIYNGYDVLPGLINKGALNHPILGHFAKRLVRLNWQSIHKALTHPRAIIEDVKARDPAKGAVLDSPHGRRWVDWTVYRVHSYLRVYAQIKGGGPVVPPQGEDPIRHALELPPG
ncbi:MAG TPA: hypothetical protein VMG99_08800 [Thermoplasmata archaeon]|nr:hypothetical protein [Thermoplasmata archaeon]